MDLELGLESVGVVAEGDQGIFKLIHSGGNCQAQEVQPALVDEGHVADGLDGGLLIAQLLDPREGPDVAVLVGAHHAILGSLLEDLLQVGHAGINVLFQSDDGALLGILLQVRVAETGGEHDFRQGTGVGHFEGNLLAPLIALDRAPFDVDVGRFFQALEDGAVVGIGFGTHREAGQGSKGLGFCEGEGVLCVSDKGHCHHQAKAENQNLGNLTHGLISFSFFILQAFCLQVPVVSG